MNYQFSKNYEKVYVKRIGRTGKLDLQVEQRLSLFVAGERGYPLDDHALMGNMSGKRAFSISGDIRIVYEENEDTIIFIDIGTHNQVYGK